MPKCLLAVPGRYTLLLVDDEGQLNVAWPLPLSVIAFRTKRAEGTRTVPGGIVWDTNRGKLFIRPGIKNGSNCDGQALFDLPLESYIVQPSGPDWFVMLKTDFD